MQFMTKFIQLLKFIIMLFIKAQTNKHYKLENRMKKVRIFKKNPHKILKTLQKSDPLKISISNSIHKSAYQDVISKKYIKNSPKRASIEPRPIIYSQRYKSSSPNEKVGWRKTSLSPYKQRFNQSLQRQKTQNIRSSLAEPHRYSRDSDTSSYFLANRRNRSINRLLVISNKKTQEDSSVEKDPKKSIRLNVLKRRTNSQQLNSQSEGLQILQEAKKLMFLGENNKSIFMVKKYLKKDPSNYDAQYILCLNLFNLGDFQRVISISQKLIRQNQSASSHLHFILLKSYHKIGSKQECLKQLEKYQALFPGDQKVYIEKGNYYMVQNQYKKATESYSKAIDINPGSLNAFQKMYQILSLSDKYQEALILLQKVINACENKQKHKLYKFKAEILLKLERYTQIISQFKQQGDPQIIICLAMAYYKSKDYLKSYLTLQSSLNSSEDCTQLFKLMLLIKIKQKNFYEATHLIQRRKHLNIKEDQIQLQSTFINGVVFLIRRDLKQGVQQLQKIHKKLQNNSLKSQTVREIQQNIHCFIAYGYYCLANYQQCQKNYSLQKQKYPQVSFQNIDYNIEMNQAFLHYSRQQFHESIAFFQKASKMNPKKLEPSLCLAITYFQIGYSQQEEKKDKFLEQARKNFQVCLNYVINSQNNTAALVFFYKSIFHAYREQWRDAILCIDEAIQRAEENYWKHFYVRALIFTSLHNFSEPINDLSIAINLSKKHPELFFLRASCFQIQGEGNHAFQDLQIYIAMRPEDTKIHKFAGKLLFENGAFQDAIKAFNHEEIQHSSQNYDAFLTKCKTHFLLGEFGEAAAQIQKIHTLFPQKTYLLFDAEMMKITRDLIDPKIAREQLIDQLNAHYENNFDDKQKNQIFKQTELHTFKAACYFQMRQYETTIKEFEDAIKAKTKILMRQTFIEGSNREDERDTRIYLSQMRLNIALCYLCMNNIQKSQENAEKMDIYEQQSFDAPYRAFLGLFNSNNYLQINKEPQIKKIEIFPNRNKISNYLPDYSFSLNSKLYYFKLCIPFPKVEPPEIFPQFDKKLFENLSVENVEKKPQAPWITIQMNSINFTGKIQKYSRLEIEDSIGDTSVEDFYPDSSHISLKSLSSRRMQAAYPQQLGKQIKRPHHYLNK